MSDATLTADSIDTQAGVRRACVASFIQKQGALIVLVLLCVVAAFRYDNFLTEANLQNILRQNSMLALVALGMTFVILTGGIDLSVGSFVALAGVIAANLAGQGTIVALLAAVAATTALGLVNGAVISKARIQPFVVTLAMMIAARGLALIATGETAVRVNSLNQGFTWLGRGTIFELSVGSINIELYVPVLIALIAYLIGWFVLNHTRFGRHTFALGDNEEAARLMGLNVGRVTLGVYALSGALAGLAGVILASRLGAGQPTEGVGWELDAIAAVVVGGTLLTGGKGGVGATIIGVLLLGVILNMIKAEGLSSWWQLVLRGAFLLAVVVVQNRLNSRKK
ncbi:MAG: ABC transporter permease [Pyrinomonadaceae bacterium MAG19_C2-C3]|nr:ABC transporter permease [Pyrinomonadaceae bacterium MAG19_C2-C3]